MKLFRTIFFFPVFLLAVHFLSAQDIEFRDSTSIRIKENHLPFTHPKQPLLLPEPSQITLDPFKNSPEFKGAPFQAPGDFPKNWMEFKHAFMALKLPEEFALTERLRRNMEMAAQKLPPLWLEKDEIIRNNTRYDSPASGLALSAGSLIQAMYDEFSHEGKMKRKYDSIVKQDNINKEVSKKYDIELVKTVTGFDDALAQKFMDFCDFKSDSILQSRQYDVYLMIYDCLSQFITVEQE